MYYANKNEKQERKDINKCLYLHPEGDIMYKVIETLTMSGPLSGPPSHSQEEIHGVTASPLSHKSIK